MPASSGKPPSNTLAGLVTYGSPLDKFAMLWPAVIPNIRDQRAFARGTWLSFYDATDPVAGHLDAFDKLGAEQAVFPGKGPQRS